VVVVSSKRVVVLASIVVVVGMVSVVGTEVDGIVTVVVVAGIVGMVTVLVDVDVVVIDAPELLVVGSWDVVTAAGVEVVVTSAGGVVLVPTVVDAPPAEAVVDGFETPGMGTPMPTAPGMVVVTRPSPVVSAGFSANRPMSSPRFGVVGTPLVGSGSSSPVTSNERTCGGSAVGPAEASSRSRSTPAKIPRTRTAAVLSTIVPDTSRPTRTLSLRENRLELASPVSANRAAICLASSSGLGLRGPVGGGNRQIPFVLLPRPGGSYGL
jgi:hypothetical protein